MGMSRTRSTFFLSLDLARDSMLDKLVSSLKKSELFLGSEKETSFNQVQYSFAIAQVKAL